MSIIYAAIDFETAHHHASTACAVGIVLFTTQEIVDEYYTLIQPPENEYHWGNVRVHGIKPKDTLNAPIFPTIYNEVKLRLQGKTIVAHNEQFDRAVLQAVMQMYQMDYDELELPEVWECTLRIARKEKVQHHNLKACCDRLGIEVNHHHALSDAKACAQLYQKFLRGEWV